MSFPTKPAFVHQGAWKDMRSHPCMAWMEKCVAAIDRKAWDTEPFSNWFTSDHVLHKSNGETVSGGEASWTSLRKEVFAPFASHLHDPQSVVVTETEDGWEMFGTATVYWNLAVPGEGAKVKSGDGKEWDGAGPGAFQFRYVKQKDGDIRLSKTAIFTDPTAAVVTMLKRGMLKPEDLMK